MIKLDKSASSVVIACTECPYWFALRLDIHEAYLAGEAHQIRAHDIEPNVASSPRRLWERRHAARS